MHRLWFVPVAVLVVIAFAVFVGGWLRLLSHSTLPSDDAYPALFKPLFTATVGGLSPRDPQNLDRLGKLPSLE